MQSSKARAWHGALQTQPFSFGDAVVPGNIPVVFEQEALRSVGLHQWLPMCSGHLGRSGFKVPLLGCVGQAELRERLLKQARKVFAVSLHPKSHIFPVP